MIARLRAFGAGPVPDEFEAAGLLRLVYLAVFALQLVLAFLVGAVTSWLVPVPGGGNDLVAGILAVMAALHLPLGWYLGRAAIRAGGRQAALAGVIAAGVLLSIPAWFGVLLLVSGQRPLYLMLIAALVSVGYSVGFFLTGVAAKVAATPEPTPAIDDGAPAQEAQR